jgi:DNA-binding IclR family transcriptional regulator
MSNREQSIRKVVTALVNLEKRLGRSPSVMEIAKESGYANGTTYNYLKEAESQGLIVQRDGKFMTHGVAEAYQKGKL